MKALPIEAGIRARQAICEECSASVRRLCSPAFGADAIAAAMVSKSRRVMRSVLSRLVGVEGFAVERVIEVGDWLDLEVEQVARAACCDSCGRWSVEVKHRPRV